MGGLMASAAGALSNGAALRARKGPGGCCAGASVGGTSSMAEWQISQAEQELAWWSWAAQLVPVSWHAAPSAAAGATEAWSWEA
jgi:hypothetical protein